MHKWKKQYRLPGFNYAINNAYFVTIVCANRTSFFGKITDNEMDLSALGLIAQNHIYRAKELKKNIAIPEYVIMPNHVHLIVILQNEEIPIKSAPSVLPLGDGFERRGHIGPQQKGALGTFVNGYKGHVTREARKQGYMDFGWQSKFNDRIIRNEKEYSRIAQYINENVVNWDEDSENKRNL
jgi:putative transposase